MNEIRGVLLDLSGVLYVGDQAFRLLMDGAPLLAMGDNRYFREADGLSLDIGPFLKALEYAADVQGALDAGLQACLVKTGKYCPGDEQRLDPQRAQVFDDVGSVVDALGI